MSVPSKALTLSVTVAAEVLCGQSPASRKSMLDAARSAGKASVEQEVKVSVAGRTPTAEVCAPGEVQVNVNTKVTSKISKTPGAKQLPLPRVAPISKLVGGKGVSPLAWKKPFPQEKLRFLTDKLEGCHTPVVNAQYPNLFINMKQTPWGREVDIPGGLWTSLALEPAEKVIKVLANLSQPADLVNPAVLFKAIVSMLKYQNPATRQKAAQLAKEGVRFNFKIEQRSEAPGAQLFILQQTHTSGIYAYNSFRAIILVTPIAGKLHVGATYALTPRAGGPAADTIRKTAVVLADATASSAAPRVTRAQLSKDDFHLSFLGDGMYVQEQAKALERDANRVAKGRTCVVEHNHAVAGLLLVMQGLNKGAGCSATLSKKLVAPETAAWIKKSLSQQGKTR